MFRKTIVPSNKRSRGEHALGISFTRNPKFPIPRSSVGEKDRVVVWFESLERKASAQLDVSDEFKARGFCNFCEFILAILSHKSQH